MLFQVAERFKVLDVDALAWAVPFPLLKEWAAHFVLSEQESKERVAKARVAQEAKAGIDELRDRPII